MLQRAIVFDETRGVLVLLKVLHRMDFRWQRARLINEVLLWKRLELMFQMHVVGCSLILESFEVIHLL